MLIVSPAEGVDHPKMGVSVYDSKLMIRLYFKKSDEEYFIVIIPRATLILNGYTY